MENNSMFDSYTLPSGVTLKNRVLMAPMTTYSSEKNGDISEDELIYYGRRAKSGIGAVITACAYIEPLGAGFQYSIGAESDERIPSLKKLASAIKGNGSKAILQIFHAGRQSNSKVLNGEQPVSASAVAAPRDNAEVPREMTETEIEKTVASFKEATRRAIEAGFDGVEIHGANTYLIHQFFSPHSNRRTDKWGGSLQKRMTFPLAIVDAVQTAAKQHTMEPFIIGYRFSPEEYQDPGFTMEDTLELLHVLAEKNLDYLHVSLGHFFGSSNRDENDTTPRIKLIQEAIGNKVPVIGVGTLETREDVEQALEVTPLIAIGRAIVTDPEWFTKLEKGQDDTILPAVFVSKKEELDIPNPLWDKIMQVKGWFKVAD